MKYYVDKGLIFFIYHARSYDSTDLLDRVYSFTALLRRFDYRKKYPKFLSPIYKAHLAEHFAGVALCMVVDTENLKNSVDGRK